MMSHIRYSKDGIILFHPTSPSGRWSAELIHTIEQDINQILQLNGRPIGRVASMTPQRVLSKAERTPGKVVGKSSSAYIKRVLVPQNRSRTKWNVCFLNPRENHLMAVTVYYLRRKYRQLIHKIIPADPLHRHPHQ